MPCLTFPMAADRSVQQRTASGRDPYNVLIGLAALPNTQSL